MRVVSGAGAGDTGGGDEEIWAGRDIVGAGGGRGSGLSFTNSGGRGSGVW